jgi:hypothetical protein
MDLKRELKGGSMDDDINLTNINVNYHRNGISGEGFVAIHFAMIGEGSENEYDGKLIAVVVPHDDGATDECKCNGMCFVVKPTRPELCYRGDHFEPDMRLIIKAHRVRQRIELEESVKSKKRYTGISKFRDMNEVRETLYPKPAIPAVTPKPSNQRFADII